MRLTEAFIFEAGESITLTFTKHEVFALHQSAMAGEGVFNDLINGGYGTASTEQRQNQLLDALESALNKLKPHVQDQDPWDDEDFK